MTRLLAAAFVLALSGVVGFAQPPGKDPAPKEPPAKDAPADDGKPPEPAPQVYALVVSPAAAPIPALRYELLPRLRDRVPGNAALDYHRAYMMRPNWPREPEASRRQDEMVSKWEELPVEKLPAKEVREFLLTYGATFKCLDQAARCDRCDWELNRKISIEGIGLLLPEVQAMREISRFNRLRIRADLAENNFDAAARGLQSGFRMSKDIAEGPTLIQMLVGIALHAVHSSAVEDWMRRPGAPNLYWSLTALPQPFIDPRPALEGETVFFDSTFPNIKEFEKGPLTADRANLMLEEMTKMFRAFNDKDGPAGLEAMIGKVGVTAYVGLHFPEAKKQLLAMGRPAAELEKMPPAQVVALRAIAHYRALSDEQTKCFYLPYPQARAELARVDERVKRLVKDNPTDVLIRLFSLTIPATSKVFEAHARTGRRIAGQRAVEAVRLHAAANGGRAPRQLADLTLVPVPDDPHTGKPFVYKATDDGFTLDALPPAGEKPNPSNSFRYEVTFRK